MALLHFLTKDPRHLCMFVFIILYLNCPVTSQWLNNFHNILRRHERSTKEGEIRLVGGSTPNQGNVEIYHMGKWGSICDDEWDQREGDIVCRSLGYLGAEKVTDNAMYGQGRSLIWIDNLYCSGNEERLQDCPFDGWGVHDCLEIEAAGVKCLENNTSPSILQSQNDDPISVERLNVFAEYNITNVTVRLIGGRTPTEGRVELQIPGKGWGVICGDGWGVLEAMVACRQLGFGYAQASIQSSFFGGKYEDLVLSGVKCTGDENSLAYCLYDEAGHVECPGKDENIAGVICTTVLPDLVPDEKEIERSSYLEDRELLYLQCAMEENCLASAAYRQKQNNDYGWQYERRRLIRFTARIGNIGTTDFRPFLPKHAWEWHMCHLHYHSMEVFAHFDIINQQGQKVAEGHKASFCLEDNQCQEGIEKKYACANYGDQGISVGCTDTYLHNIDCQWIDITELPTGLYFFKVAINPEFKVPEITFNNNAATCYFYYNAVSARVWNCTLGRP